jgi:endogenous inhibitor of DNA gyrase (YacG/DUF329 family)
MQTNRYLPDDGTLTKCTWCGAQLGQNIMPAGAAIVFCSRRCEIEANFWLYQEMCAIEIMHPLQSADGQCDSP